MKKWICWALALLCLLCIAQAEPDDLKSLAMADLTEVLGYTAEEAARFVFEPQPDGSLRYWPPEHPEWVYTSSYEDGSLRGSTPFRTEDWLNHPSEALLREALASARAEGWFAHWGLEACRGLRGFFSQWDVPLNVDAVAAFDPEGSAAEAVCGLFRLFFGPEYLWPAAVTGWRDSVLAEYGLEPVTVQTYAPGIRRVRNGLAEAVIFNRETPEELEAAFAHPCLAGWQVLSGCIETKGLYNEQALDKGLAAFEKDGRRLLVLLAKDAGRWRAVPLGENALYPDCDLAITCDGASISFTITYALSDHETAAFHVAPQTYTLEGDWQMYCSILAYLRVDTDTGELVRISSTSNQPWRVRTGVIGEAMETEEVPVQYPVTLGTADILDFPTTLSEAKAVNALPAAVSGGSLVFGSGVHLRAKTSSRSTDLGLLDNSVLLPVLDVQSGSEAPWIHTRLGRLEGYVSSNYTSYGKDAPTLYRSQTVAKAAADIDLKKGTGLLDGTEETLPAGTKMHVVLEDGNWLYVSVPQGDMHWYMDLNGVFGYVKKADVRLASLPCQLDWLE